MVSQPIPIFRELLEFCVGTNLTLDLLKMKQIGFSSDVRPKFGRPFAMASHAVKHIPVKHIAHVLPVAGSAMYVSREVSCTLRRIGVGLFEVPFPCSLFRDANGKSIICWFPF